jgi:hypothetical protein
LLLISYRSIGCRGIVMMARKSRAYRNLPTIEPLERRDLLDAAVPALIKFDSPADFDSYFLNQALAKYGNEFGQPYFPPPVPLYPQTYSYENPVPDPSLPADSANAGNTTYLVSGGQLFILGAQPDGGLAIEGRVSASTTPWAIYLDGSRVAIVSQLSVPVNPGVYYSPQQSRIDISIYDVGNPAQPTLVSDTQLEGGYRAAQLVGDNLHIVVENNKDGLPGPGNVDNGDGTRRYQTEAEYIASISADIADEVLPHYYVPGSPADARPTGLVSQPTDVYQPRYAGDLDLVSALTLNMAAAGTPVADTQTMVAELLLAASATSENLLLAIRHGSSGAADPAGSIIQRFDYQGAANIPGSVGFIPAYVLYYFESALNFVQSNGLLYVIAVDSPYGSSETAALYVLQENGSQLDQVGFLNGLGAGYQPGAVSVAGNTIYLDENLYSLDSQHSGQLLLIIDVSDPVQPKLSGQVRAAGGVDNLRTLNQDFLLAVGAGTVDRVNTYTLFAVGDVTTPAVAQHGVLPNVVATIPGDSSYVDAVGQFSYFADQNLIVIPVQQTDIGTTTQSTYYGSLIFQLTGQNGLQLNAVVPQDSQSFTGFVQNGMLDLVAKQSVLQVPAAQPGAAATELRLYDNPRSVQTPWLNAEAGIPFHGDLLTFAVTDPTGLTATIEWDDGTKSPGQIVSKGGQWYSVVGQGLFQQQENTGVRVTFTRDGVPAGTFYVLVQVTFNPQLEYFLTRVYADMLGRNIEDAARSYWSLEINEGMARAAVVETILASPEYKSLRITELYRKLLGRTPGGPEISYWLDFASAGHDLATVVRGMASSPEYYAKSGGNVRDFVFAVYDEFLGRGPEAPSLAAWDAALQNGWSTSTVVNAIATSAEAATHQVYINFLSYLKRMPEPGAVIYFSTTVANVRSPDSVTAAIVGSDEFFRMS